MFSTLSDLDVITPDADSLPPPSSHISLDISRHEVSLNTSVDLDNASHESTGECLCERFSANGSLKHPDLYRLLPSPLSEDFSLSPFLLPRTFLSERNSLGSMDWPPIGSSLLPADGNARHDELLEKRKSLDSEVAKTIADLPFPGLAVSEDDPETWLLNNTPDAPPIWTVTRSSRQDCSSVTNSSTSLASRDHVPERPLHLRPPPRIADRAFPVFPRITLPPLSLPPVGIHKMLERHIPSSVPRNDYGDTEIGSAAPDPLLVSLLSSTQSGKFHSTGNVSQ
jgi:hypothetical protein